MPRPDDSTTGLLKRTFKPRTVTEERLRRIYNERANGASMDLLRFKHSCSQDTVRKAFLHFGGDPLGKSKAKPSNRATPEAVPTPNPEPPQQRTFTPYTAQGSGRTWADPIRWHERCHQHGRVQQFCVDCKRSPA